MVPVSKRDSKPAGGGPPPGRNYAGVRITAPPRSDSAGGRTEKGLVDELERQLPTRSIDRGQQVRILTGAALFGVIITVLLHEFGHWLTGFAVTGSAPDYLLVAVRQKTAEFSTFGGVLTWGAGPLLHLAAIWVLVVWVTSRKRLHHRLFAVAGGALVFALVVHVINWTGATFSSTASWENDLPKVATFFGSWAVAWMHFLSVLFMLALLLPAYVWITVARSTGNQGLYFTPAIMGAVQGGVLVLIASFFVALSQ